MTDFFSKASITIKIFKAAYTLAKPCWIHYKNCYIFYINMSISSYFNFSGDKIVFKFKYKAISKHFFNLLKDFVLMIFYLLEYNRISNPKGFCEKYDAKNLGKFIGENQWWRPILITNSQTGKENSLTFWKLKITSIKLRK